MALLRKLRRAVLMHSVPEAIERVAATESTAAGVRVADWVVERLDLSGFGPHVTMETLRAVNDMMPHIREIRLLPPKRLSAARTRSIYDVEVVPISELSDDDHSMMSPPMSMS